MIILLPRAKGFVFGGESLSSAASQTDDEVFFAKNLSSTKAGRRFDNLTHAQKVRT